MADYIEVGEQPANVIWNVVRGDTATLLIQFFESDEATPIDTDDWTYLSTAYNARTDTNYVLDITSSSGSVTVTADPETTEAWGEGISTKVAELTYDIQVVRPDGVVWTPVIGTIRVIGDVTGANL